MYRAFPYLQNVQFFCTLLLISLKELNNGHLWNWNSWICYQGKVGNWTDAGPGFSKNNYNYISTLNFTRSKKFLVTSSNFATSENFWDLGYWEIASNREYKIWKAFRDEHCKAKIVLQTEPVWDYRWRSSLWTNLKQNVCNKQWNSGGLETSSRDNWKTLTLTERPPMAWLDSTNTF